MNKLGVGILFLLGIVQGYAEDDLTRYVNPFIGTGGHGHTFPGATLPHGMVQLSPDTRIHGWDACSGYHYSDSTILGFSHIHLSGTGIGDYGDFLFMPFTGDLKIDDQLSNYSYKSHFNKDNEIASPGYYSVYLDDHNVKVELTASQRAGFHKYSFPVDKAKSVILDLNHSIHGHKIDEAELRIINEYEIAGYRQTNGWAKEHKLYFYARFDQPFEWIPIRDDEPLDSGQTQITGNNLKTILRFAHGGTQLQIKVGISAVDFEGARKNLDAEISGWNFSEVLSSARNSWNAKLKKIKVSGKSADDRTIFYTALYHSMIAPNIYSDVDGRYRAMDKEIYKDNAYTNYTVFSLWDTFRALHPLLNIIEPRLNSEFVRVLLRKRKEGGILPKWELASNYTGTMIGYHSVSVIADAYVKGNRNYDAEEALQAMIEASNYDKNMVIKAGSGTVRALNTQAKRYNEEVGYVPAEEVNESVAKALEYAYNDWCIAQMAKSLGNTIIYEKYMDRAQRYKNYFDEETLFMRGKKLDGKWREPFHPKYSNHRQDDYCEGNAWQWTWFVPHDVPGLIELMGGRQVFTERLDSLFSTTSEIIGEHTSSDISGLIGQYAHGNEPSHHIAHLYNFSNTPWKTQQICNQIMTTLYFNDPNGLAGNEDCGQMSAWYILNAIGMYSISPGSTAYSLGRPLFDDVEINLDNGKKFRIQAVNNSRQNMFVKAASLNGVPIKQPFIEHADIVDGGTLELVMTSEPQ